MDQPEGSKKISQSGEETALFSLSCWLNRAQSLLPRGLTDPSSCKYHQGALSMNSNFYHVIGESDVTCLCIVLTTYESCIAVI